MKARYLTFFSYIGTNYRRSEKLWLRDGVQYRDPESIQGVMEMGLLKLKSLNYPRVALSSRTDGGVHALNATAHLDLERYGSHAYEAEAISTVLNKYFFLNNHSILVNEVKRVSDSFDARFSALSRTYLYRLATTKKGVTLPEKSSIIPVEELKRCHFIRSQEFDIEKFKLAAAYFPGYHDFGSFKRYDKKTSGKQCRRMLYSIDVRQGAPAVTSYTRMHEDSLFDYWDVQIRGRAFIHRQIRRMMGIMVAVALGRFPAEEIKVMLQVPSKYSWPPQVVSLPAHGLYLCNVEYQPQDLLYDPTSKQVPTYSEDDSESE